MKIFPRGEWILVEPSDVSRAGGLYVPDSVDQQYLKGKIILLGDPKDEHAIGLEPGQTVVYDRVGAVTVTLGIQKFTLMRAREVLGIVQEDQ